MTLQENILMSVNGTNRLAKYIMNEKVLPEIDEALTDAISYVNNYVNFLDAVHTNGITDKQPYNVSTNYYAYNVGGVWAIELENTHDGIQINKPFTALSEKI